MDKRVENDRLVRQASDAMDALRSKANRLVRVEELLTETASDIRNGCLTELEEIAKRLEWILA